MKRFAAALFMLSALYAPAQEGTLTFDPPEWDYGSIPDDAVVSVGVDIRNTTDTDTRISLVPTCDCLAAEPDRAELRAGETLTVRLRFDPDGYDGETEFDFIVTTDIGGLEKLYYYVYGTVQGSGGQAAGGSEAVDRPAEGAEVVLRYYYSPGCSSCRTFLARDIPEVERELGITLGVIERYISEDDAYEEYQRLLAVLGEEAREYPALLVGTRLMQGEREIGREVQQAVADALRAGTGRFDPFEADLPGAGAVTRLAVVPVLAAGLLDGVNPCAFTTLIFLISALAVAGRGRREVLVIGIFFTLSVFVSYYVIGMGTFSALRVASGFPVVALVIKWALVAVLFVFAGLSIYDYVIIRLGAPTKILLQLPSGVKRRIHSSIKAQARSAALVASALVMGFLVSVFELACTGQVYFPTIAYMVRMGRGPEGYLYLLVYNLGFIVPLLVVFALSYFGLSSKRLTSFMQESMGTVKLALAALFIALAVVTIVT